MAMSSPSSASSTRCVMRYSSPRTAFPRVRFTCRPDKAVARDATGDGPEYRYGGASTFSASFIAVGSAMNASNEEYALENPATRIALS